MDIGGIVLVRDRVITTAGHTLKTLNSESYCTGLKALEAEAPNTNSRKGFSLSKDPANEQFFLRKRFFQRCPSGRTLLTQVIPLPGDVGGKQTRGHGS